MRTKPVTTSNTVEEASSKVDKAAGTVEKARPYKIGKTKK
jgi:hypothetical protein